jgi:hypothetical protein
MYVEYDSILYSRSYYPVILCTRGRDPASQQTHDRSPGPSTRVHVHVDCIEYVANVMLLTRILCIFITVPLQSIPLLKKSLSHTTTSYCTCIRYWNKVLRVLLVLSCTMYAGLGAIVLRTPRVVCSMCKCMYTLEPRCDCTVRRAMPCLKRQGISAGHCWLKLNRTLPSFTINPQPL